MSFWLELVTVINGIVVILINVVRLIGVIKKDLLNKK